MTEKEDLIGEEKFTPQQVAVIFNRSRRTVYRWIEEEKTFLSGEIIYVKDGYLIRKSAVERLLKKEREESRKKKEN